MTSHGRVDEWRGIAAFMVRHLVHSEALYNRKTYEIKLGPMPAKEAISFFGDFRSKFEAMRFLMVLGGVPKYLEQVDPTRSLAENLDDLCFHKHGFFAHEFETIFKEQFKVTRTYKNIVSALASKRLSREQLSSNLKLCSGGGFSSYLSNLEQADFVRVFHPVSIKAARSRGKGSRTTRVELWDERHVAFHPKGNFAYCNLEMTSQVCVLTYDQDSGGLEVIQTISTLPEGFADTNSTAEILVHPSGRFVYVSNRGHNSIAAFAIDQFNGKLTYLGNYPTQGEIPRNFGISPDGGYVIVANQKSDNVAVLRIEPGTGKLHFTGESIAVPSPVCVRFHRD